MNTKSTKLIDEIERIKSELETVKPRSRRKVELEDRLKTLVTQVLRKDNRISKRGESLLVRKPPRAPSLGQPNSQSEGILSA